MADSIRERILKQLARNFEAVQQGVDDYILTWNTIKRSSPDDVEQVFDNTVGIIEGAELNTNEQQTVRKNLEVFTEFWVRTQLGDDKSELANSILSDVQRLMFTSQRVLESGTGTQLAIDINEVSNELDLENEELIGGVVTWRVTYRHSQEDPRSQIGPLQDC